MEWCIRPVDGARILCMTASVVLPYRQCFLVSVMALANSYKESSNMWIESMNGIRIAGSFSTVIGHRRLSVWKPCWQGFYFDGWSGLAALKTEYDENRTAGWKKL